MTLCFEYCKIIHHFTTEIRTTIFKRGFVDDDLRALGLDAFHHALDTALPEVVAVALHRQPVHADEALLLLGGVVVAMAVVVVVARLAELLVGDEVLACAVALDDGLDEVLRHVFVVGQQLLGVLGQAVAAVAERRVVVEVADAWVEAHALDDAVGVETLHLGVGVQLVEVAHAQGEVGVGEELHGLGLGESHEQRRDVFLDGSLLEQGGEGVGGGVEAAVALRPSDDDTAGIEVVVQGLALAQELRGEDDVVAVVFAPHAVTISHGDGRLDDHDGLRIHLHDELDDLLDMARVEIVLLRVVVGRRGDNHEVGIAVGGGPVEGGREVQVLLREVLLDIFILYGRLAPVDHIDLLGDDVDGFHLMVLAEQCGDAQSHVASAGYRYFNFFVVHQYLSCTHPLRTKSLRPSSDGMIFYSCNLKKMPFGTNICSLE